MKSIIILFCSFTVALTSCIGPSHRINTDENHKDVKIGIAETSFLETAEEYLQDLDKMKPKGSMFDDGEYLLYQAIHPSKLNSIKYYYVFKNSELIYYNQAGKFGFTGKPIYVEIAKQAHKHFN